jgi:hypothetical protein
MKPLDFLADVLPLPGNGLYCVTELSSRKKEHFFVESLPEIRPKVKTWLSESREIYFSLATFKDDQSRKAQTGKINH